MFAITTTDFGGTETALLELVRRLPEHGFEPLVCSLCKVGKIGREIEAAGIPVFGLDMTPEASVPEMFTAVRALARLIDGERVDVLQTLLYRANAVGALAARLARRRPALIASQRSMDPGIGPMSVRIAAFARRFADTSVAVSEAVRTKLLADEGVAPDRVVVIPNGVDPASYVPSDRAAARAALGLDANAFIVGGIGRLSVAKGFHDLLEAATVAGGLGLPLHLAIAGDGPERQALELRSAALGRRVSFLGFRRDLVTIYSAIDVFALPSLTEGSPNALIEAMMCGRACVATDVGGVREIMENERSGLVVPPAKPELFARAIARLAEDPALRHSLGAGARSRVTEHFTIAATVRKHAELYDGVLRHRNGTAPR
jgi:glycosyltransferase involved in cell wall biosynthesis